MMLSAGVAELVDALDLGSSDESCGGSSPSARTKRFQRLHDEFLGGLSWLGWARRTTGADLRRSRACFIDTVQGRFRPRTNAEED
jgi:hypothetical protein